MRVCVKRSDGIAACASHLRKSLLIFDTKINCNSDLKTIIYMFYLKSFFTTANNVIHDIDAFSGAKSMVYTCESIFKPMK